MFERLIFVKLTINLFVIALAIVIPSPVQAGLTHDATYKMDGTVETPSGKTETEGTIVGKRVGYADDEAEKALRNVIATSFTPNGKLPIDEAGWEQTVNAIRNLEVTSTIELCVPAEVDQKDETVDLFLINIDLNGLSNDSDSYLFGNETCPEQLSRYNPDTPLRYLSSQMAD